MPVFQMGAAGYEAAEGEDQQDGGAAAEGVEQSRGEGEPEQDEHQGVPKGPAPCLREKPPGFGRGLENDALPFDSYGPPHFYPK